MDSRFCGEGRERSILAFDLVYSDVESYRESGADSNLHAAPCVQSETKIALTGGYAATSQFGRYRSETAHLRAVQNRVEHTCNGRILDVSSRIEIEQFLAAQPDICSETDNRIRSEVV